MNTRPNRKGDTPGFYKYRKQIYQRTVNATAHVSRKNSLEYNFLRNVIRYKIARLLNQHRKTSAIKHFFLLVSDSLSNNLKENYYLSGRFAQNPRLFHDLQVLNTRYFSTNNFTTLEADTFQVKLSKKHKISNFFPNNQLINQFLAVPYCLSFKFRIKENVISNQDDESFSDWSEF
jgi:hypothetical protein